MAPEIDEHSLVRQWKADLAVPNVRRS